MDKSASLSKTFNNKSLNRFVLLKKGYFTNKDSLPSLHIFEINVLLAKFYYYKSTLSFENPRLFSFVVEVLRNYLEKSEVLEQALSGLRDSSSILIVEEELNREFKEKNYREKQTSLLFMYDLLNEYICPYLTRLDIDPFPFLPELEALIDALIDFISRCNVRTFSRLKCLRCLGCQDCEERVGKVKPHVPMEDFLKKLIRLKGRSIAKSLT